MDIVISGTLILQADLIRNVAANLGAMSEPLSPELAEAVNALHSAVQAERQAAARLGEASDLRDSAFKEHETALHERDYARSALFRLMEKP